MSKIRGQQGQAFLLAMLALVIGMLLVAPFLGLVGTSLTGSGTYGQLLRQNYSADAGVEYAIWHLQQGTTTVPSFVINGDTVDVVVTDQGSGVYGIVSTATREEGTVTIHAVVEVSSGGPADELFTRAVLTLNGDIRLDADGRIYSDDYPALNAPVFAHGSIVMNNETIIDGDAYATGTIRVASAAAVNGIQYPGSDALDMVGQLAILDADIAGWKAETLSHGCVLVACGPYTYTGKTYNPPSGTYLDPVNARQNMTLSTWGGIWAFQDTVCVGVDTSRHLTISNGSTTFEGPVTVGNNLNISGWSTTVTFMDKVCIGGDITIADGATVIFNGPVSVGDDAVFGGWSSRVDCLGTVYAAGRLTIDEGVVVSFSDTVYASERLTITDNAVITGGQTIISDGIIVVRGSASSLNGDVSIAADIPYLVSTSGTITFNDAAGAVALVYAPAGEVQIRGYANSIVGAVTGMSFRMLNWGTNHLVFPADLRGDAGIPSGDGGDGISILSWNVSSS